MRTGRADIVGLCCRPGHAHGRGSQVRVRFQFHIAASLPRSVARHPPSGRANWRHVFGRDALSIRLGRQPRKHATQDFAKAFELLRCGWLRHSQHIGGSVVPKERISRPKAGTENARCC